MSLVFAGHRCCEHSPSSGYDQVCAVFPNAGWLNGPELAAGRIAWFREPAAFEDSPSQVFHVFYGDSSGSALPVILRARFPGSTIVSTIHQPIDRLRRDPRAIAALSASDGIIAIAEVQAKQLASLRLKALVRVVPHGVWTEVFRPDAPDAVAARSRLLLVGGHLRDWAGTCRLLRLLCAAGIGTTVVGRSAVNRLCFHHPLIESRPHVSEAELVSLYRRSAALLLPALDATASNALLEAMSAGCPVICPTLPSLIEEYLGDDCDAYEPGCYDRAAELAQAYVTGPERRSARSRALLQRAERFDWSRLRPGLLSAYDEIAGHVQHR